MLLVAVILFSITMVIPALQGTPMEDLYAGCRNRPYYGGCSEYYHFDY
jgi:hypothetical protein